MPSLASVGAFICGTSVALGAFGAHALREKLDVRMLEVFETAVRYQFFHGLAFLVLGLRPGIGWTQATLGMLIGIFLFSGSLYALVAGAPRWIGAVTPIGGSLLILAWGLLSWNLRRG